MGLGVMHQMVMVYMVRDKAVDVSEQHGAPSLLRSGSPPPGLVAVSQDGAGGQEVLGEQDQVFDWFLCVRCNKGHVRVIGGEPVLNICKQCGGEDCCVGENCGL